MESSRRGRVLGALLFGLLSFASHVRAAEQPTLAYQGTVDLSAAGDARAEIKLDLAGEFAAIRAGRPDPRVFLTRVRWGGEDHVFEGAQARYDEASRSVVAVVPMRGLARGRGSGEWELRLPAPMEVVGLETSGPRAAARLKVSRSWPERVRYAGELTVLLPPGATAVAVRGKEAVTWKLSPPGTRGEGALEVRLEVPDRLMTCPYKVYASADALPRHWVGRAVIRNVGPGPVGDLQVRYRLAGYSEWSPWSRYAALAPGQTVVDRYHPVLDAAVARLRTSTPADLLLEWSWTDEKGVRRTGDDAARLTLLGGTEFVLQGTAQGEELGGWVDLTSNAPLLAAWATRNDPVLMEFAALANKNAGGVMADQDAQTALAVMRHCYELALRNDFTYQGATAVHDKSVSFDERLVQAVRFPRDVIRDRSGTCIELACLYAAMVQSLGLEPFLVLVPGHCFPAVQLPKTADVRGVEMTMIGGGARGSFLGFDEALAEGTKELAEAVASGDFHLLNLRDVWGRGVANPELSDLPANILRDWKISAEGRGLPQPGPAADDGRATWAGDWTVSDGRLTVALPGGPEVAFALAGTVDASPTGACRVKLTGSGSMPAQARLLGAAVHEGRALELTLTYSGQFVPARQRYELGSVTRTVAVNPQGSDARTYVLEPDALGLSRQDGRWIARFGSTESGWTTVDLGEGEK